MFVPRSIRFHVSCFTLIACCTSVSSAFAQRFLSPGQAIASFADHSTRQAVQTLSQHGVALHSTSVSDLSRSPFATQGDQNWFMRYSLDVSMDVDGERALGWKGASFHLDLKRHSDMSGYLSGSVVQGYSNIDAAPRTYLYEAWIVQNLSRGLEVQAGKIDANTRFATVASAADFLNSSMGYSPTIMSFPTYPYPQPGFDVSLNLPAGSRITAGGFRAGAGKMILAQAARSWTTGSTEAAGNIEFGYWRLRQALTTGDDKRIGGTGGCYIVAEQTLWKPESSHENASARSLTAFLQVGNGDARVNSFAFHLGLGAVFQGPFSKRRADSFGLAATRVRAGAFPGAAPPAPEFVSELYYKLAWTPALALVGDAQYFLHPGARGDASPFLVVTPRIVVSF